MHFDIIGNKMSIYHMHHRTSISLTPYTDSKIVDKKLIDEKL